MKWHRGPVLWQLHKTLYCSVVFTWDVPRAIDMINKRQNEMGTPYGTITNGVRKNKFKVVVGGPGAMLMKEKFDGIAEIKNNLNPLEPVLFHNPLATFTTRGCINKCPFCAVPIIEGGFKEIKDFSPRPIVCDNNFLASSKSHFNKVIDKLKPLPFIDFNQGLDARLFKKHVANRLCELKQVQLRFAFDHISMENAVVDAIKLAQTKGFKNIGCYLLFGFKDTPSDALYRAKILQSLKVLIYPMRYQPLNAVKKNMYIATNNGWTNYELNRFRAYWMHREFHKMKFEEFDPSKQLRQEDCGFGFYDKYKMERKKLYEGETK